jgi:predicted outer membrane protein
MKPALSAALTHWRIDWQATRDFDLAEGQRLLRADAEGHSVKQQAEIDALRAEMAAALAAKDEQLQALSDRSGMDVLTREQEHAKALAEQAEAAHEARVAHLQQAAARRMMRAGLTKGWQTWLDMYLEHQRQTRMLAGAAGRLMKPALSAALSAWREDWDEERRLALEEGQALLRAEQAQREGGFRADLLSKEQEHAKALAEALEAEAEKRVAHLQQMAAKRMMQAGLTKGWQTWLDMYQEHQRHKRMLAGAAGRLMKPALAAALTAWRDDWGEERRRILEEGQRLLRAEAEGHSAQQQAEIDALRAEMAAAEIGRGVRIGRSYQGAGAREGLG